MLWWWGEKQGDKSRTDEAERWEAARLAIMERPAPIYFPIPAARLQLKVGKKNVAADFSKKWQCKKKKKKRENCYEFARTNCSRWRWRFSLLHVLFHLFNLGSLGGHSVLGRVWLSAHVVKWNRPASALGWSGRGGRGVDALGFARPNKLHQPRIWDVEVNGLHKQCSLICLENKWAQVMSTYLESLIAWRHTIPPLWQVFKMIGRLSKKYFLHLAKMKSAKTDWLAWQIRGGQYSILTKLILITFRRKHDCLPSWDKSFRCSSKISAWDIAWSLAWFSWWILIVSSVLSRTWSPWPDTNPGPVIVNRETKQCKQGESLWKT